MAGRGPQTFKKRQKEQQRKEKQQEKLARRLERRQAAQAGVEPREEDEGVLEKPDSLLDPLSNGE
ncbi:MAG: hypothetical protein JOY54_02620 [Acidobacteriaceae bacterium]|nr:hypothetical protein [Acidobacteriaceae bacterium]